MASTFFGLNISTSGIYAAQAGINTTGHNISNEHTKGYTKQVIDQTASNPISAYATYGMVGSGTMVTGISQIRDSYYDVKYRNNESKLGEYSTKYTYNLQIEDYFNEFETDGFSAEYDKLFDTLSSIAGNPSELNYRTEFLNYAQSVSDYLNETQNNLTELQMQCNTEVSNMTDRINNITSQVASLTKQINTVELTGSAANDLRDKREVLLDELSGIVPVTVNETKHSNGKTDYQVSVQGYTLVDNYSTHDLKLVERQDKQNSMDMPGLYDIYYFYDNDTKTGTKFDVQSMGLTGNLRATLDVRDGNNGKSDDTAPNPQEVKYKGVPYYIDKIQTFKNTIAQAFNDVHQKTTKKDADGNDVPANYNLYGNTTEDIPIFIMDINGTMTVNQDLINDPSLLATSGEPIQNGKDNSELADKLLGIKELTIFNNSTAQDYLQSIVSEVAVDVEKSSTFEKNYTNIKKSVTNQRLSVSGVDGDEEAMNLTKYQEAFNLSSKMISVMQQIYNKLINETGI